MLTTAEKKQKKSANTQLLLLLLLLLQHQFCAHHFHFRLMRLGKHWATFFQLKCDELLKTVQPNKKTVTVVSVSCRLTAVLMTAQQSRLCQLLFLYWKSCPLISFLFFLHFPNLSFPSLSFTDRLITLQ